MPGVFAKPRMLIKRTRAEISLVIRMVEFPAVEATLPAAILRNRWHLSL
jgi:hypothetical protein